MNLKAWSKQNDSLIFATVASLIIMSLRFFFLGDQVGIFHYSFRDYARAVDLLNGNFIWYGPELNLGGYLPGPFFYYLQAFALLIKSDFISVVYLCYGLYGLAVFTLSYWLVKRWGILSASTGVLLFYSSSSISTTLFRLWNPSFLFLFITLALVCFYEGFKEKKPRFLYFGLFMTSLGGQLHLTGFYFLLIFLIWYWYFSRDSKKVILGRKEKILAIFFFFLPMIPFFIWLIPEYSFENLFLVGKSQYKNVVLPKGVVRKEGFWRVFKNHLDLFWLLNPLVLLGLRKIFKEERDKNLDIFGWTTLFLLIGNYIIFLTNKRYVLVFNLVYIVYTAILLGSFKKNRMIVLVVSVFSLITFSYRNLYRIQKSLNPKHSIFSIRGCENPPNLKNSLKVVDYIYQRTNWAPKNFEDRTLQLVACNFEYGTLYRERVRGLGNFEKNRFYDGVIIIPYVEKFKDKPLEVLSRIDFSRHFDYFFKVYKLGKKEIKRIGDMVVILYKVNGKSAEDVPHNLGRTYFKREYEKKMESVGLKTGQAGVFDFDGEKYVVWKFGVGVLFPLSISFHLDKKAKNKGGYRRFLTLESHTLRLTTPFHDNFYDQFFFYNLEVELIGEKDTILLKYPKLLGASILGDWAPEMVKKDLLKSPLLSNVTPIKREFNFKCPQTLKKIIIRAPYFSHSRFRYSQLISEKKDLIKEIPINNNEFNLCEKFLKETVY